MEEEANEEVQRILLELVPDMPQVQNKETPEAQPASGSVTLPPSAPRGAAAAEETDEDDVAMAALQARASAL